MGVGPPGLSGQIWSELAAVRWDVVSMVAARRGAHPAPPATEYGLAYLIAGLIKEPVAHRCIPQTADAQGIFFLFPKSIIPEEISRIIA